MDDKDRRLADEMARMHINALVEVGDLPPDAAIPPRAAPMARLADTVALDSGVDPTDVETCLIDAINLAWQSNGNEARCSVPANFVGWMLQEIARLRADNERQAAALDNSNSLLAALLIERRPDDEIEKQIVENRNALTNGHNAGGENA